MSDTYVEIEGYARISRALDVEKLLEEIDMDDEERVEFYLQYLDEYDVENWPDFGWSISQDGKSISLHSDGYANIESAIQFGKMLVDLAMSDEFELAWCLHGDCVSGGAFFVDKNGQQSVDTASFLMYAKEQSGKLKEG